MLYLMNSKNQPCIDIVHKMNKSVAMTGRNKIIQDSENAI